MHFLKTIIEKLKAWYHEREDEDIYLYHLNRMYQIKMLEDSKGDNNAS